MHGIPEEDELAVAEDVLPVADALPVADEVSEALPVVEDPPPDEEEPVETSEPQPAAQPTTPPTAINQRRGSPNRVTLMNRGGYAIQPRATIEIRASGFGTWGQNAPRSPGVIARD